MTVRADCDVAIVGAGPAGCAAAIALARQGVRVTLLEKRRYPAHRLCGEFLSTEVMDLFEHLGVAGAIRAAGPALMTTARLYTASGEVLETSLPGTALGLSRYRMDALLFEQACAAGADGRAGTTVRAVTGDLRSGFLVDTGDGMLAARVVLGAWGKRDRLDARLRRAWLTRRTVYVATKAHFDGVALPGRVELHAVPGGYCGLSHVEDGRVNACWVTRADVLREAGGKPQQLIDRVFSRHPALADRFARMHAVTPFVSVGGLDFAPKGPWAGDVCLIGDTAALIAPLCGDGMAMALQSGLLAARHTMGWLEGRLDHAAFRRGYARAWSEAFRGRVLLGQALHAGFTRPAVADRLLPLLARLPAVTGWLVRKTRGGISPGRHGAAGP